MKIKTKEYFCIVMFSNAGDEDERASVAYVSVYETREEQYAAANKAEQGSLEYEMCLGFGVEPVAKEDAE